MVKAKVDFLWYKQGEKIKEQDGIYIDAWKKGGLIDESKEEPKPLKASKPKKKSVKKSSKKKKKSFAKKAGDLVEDILDDGKLNKSND